MTISDGGIGEVKSFKYLGFFVKRVIGALW